MLPKAAGCCPYCSKAMLTQNAVRLHVVATASCNKSWKAQFSQQFPSTSKCLPSKQHHQESPLPVSDSPANNILQGIADNFVLPRPPAVCEESEGSKCRQIVATKVNDHSSWPHSVFTITVHIKEPGPAGDDLLKTGKMNLVDLAGSENIGWSGAEN